MLICVENKPKTGVILHDLYVRKLLLKYSRLNSVKRKQGIPHTRPNRRSNAHVDDDALHQNCAEVAEDSDGRLIRIPMIRIAIGVVMGWAMLTTACTA